MKPLVLVLLLTMSTACTTRRQSLIAMGVGAAMFAGSALMIHDSSQDDDGPPLLGLLAAVGAVGGAGMFVLSGINAIDTPWSDDVTPRVKWDVASYDACMRRRSEGCGIPPTAAERAAQRDSVRERAWLITTAIESAARAGDCAAVVRADAEVAALDADFHATVFRRDAAIARCLAP